MAIEILLPKLGLTMEEGTVDEWLVADGTVVVTGMPLLRLATDKIDVDVEAEGEGIRAIARELAGFVWAIGIEAERNHREKAP